MTSSSECTVEAALGAEEAGDDDDDGDKEGQGRTQSRVHGHVILSTTGEHCTRDTHVT